MDNQHRKISGYRELNEAEIAEMNVAKRLAEEVGKFIKHLESRTHADNGYEPDQRWLHIAKTELQKGFMFLTRSVANPTTF